MASTCKACGAPIVWVETPARKWIPCDEGLVPYKQSPQERGMLLQTGARLSVAILILMDSRQGWRACLIGIPAQMRAGSEVEAMAGKTNPHKIPRTQADVDKAFDRGVLIGCSNAAAMFLTVICDKFNGADYIPDIWREINKLAEEVAERRVSVSDLRATLREEYGIEV